AATWNSPRTGRSSWTCCASTTNPSGTSRARSSSSRDPSGREKLNGDENGPRPRFHEGDGREGQGAEGAPEEVEGQLLRDSILALDLPPQGGRDAAQPLAGGALERVPASP